MRVLLPLLGSSAQKVGCATPRTGVPLITLRFWALLVGSRRPSHMELSLGVCLSDPDEGQGKPPSGEL
jgi:hypothetical protein